MTLACSQLVLSYGGSPIIKGVSLDFRQGCITTLLGPNGCGKSTLLRGLAGLLRPQGGKVQLSGKDLDKWPRRMLAQQLAFLPQTQIIPEGLKVRELVAHGRFPYQGLLDGAKKSDREAVQWALECTDMVSLSERDIAGLSGGERQRAWIAMALTQQARVLLLDEPTTYLDLGHQLETLQLLSELNRKQGLTIIMSLHDINQAIRYSNDVVVLRDGRLVCEGKPTDIITSDLLAEVFRVKASLLRRPEDAVPICYAEAPLKNITSSIKELCNE